MNKDTVHALTKEHDVKVPETVRVTDGNFYEKIERVIKFPCLVKPVDSPSFVMKFRRKLFVVNTMEELDDALQKAEEAGLEVIVQRIIPGFDDHMHTFDAYLNQEAKVTHWVTCQKKRPVATSVFFNKVIERTDAKGDQEHIDMVILTCHTSGPYGSYYRTKGAIIPRSSCKRFSYFRLCGRLQYSNTM
ncbi:hypothetical protein [Virgibacillus sp. CBA3643]|uniref:hypothetical protein n=1 Tax=Virgibacillus sp. CBA3643 TaxID=2942278 RepID=UPI0035A30B8A